MHTHQKIEADVWTNWRFVFTVFGGKFAEDVWVNCRFVVAVFSAIARFRKCDAEKYSAVWRQRYPKTSSASSTQQTTQHNNTIKLGAKFQSSEHAVFLKLCPKMMWWFFLAQMWMWKTACWSIDWWKDSGSWFFLHQKAYFWKSHAFNFQFLSNLLCPHLLTKMLFCVLKAQWGLPRQYLWDFFLVLSHCKVWSG